MNPFMPRIISFVSVLALGAASTMAAPSLHFYEVPIPAGTAVTGGSTPAVSTLDGFRSYDLIMKTASDWTAIAMLIELSSGSIFQEFEGFGGNGTTLGQPDPAGFPTLPSSEFDSYIFDPHGGALIAGAAGDVGGDIQQFDSTEIDISWSSAGADTADIGTFSIARITLSPDAHGYVQHAYTLAGESEVFYHSSDIFSGLVCFGTPEPTSAALLGLGGLALLRRRV